MRLLGTQKWLRPTKDQLAKPGDRVKIKHGMLTLISFNIDETANMEARDAQGAVLKFKARRGPDGEWDEQVEIDMTTLPDSARPFFDDVGLPEFDINMIGNNAQAWRDSAVMITTPGVMTGWQNGFKAASMSENIPLRGDELMRAGGPVEPTINRLRGDLKDNRREAARVERELSRARVKHHKTPRLSDAEYESDIARVSMVLKMGLKLEKPQGSSFHHLMQYVGDKGATMSEHRETWDFINRNFQCMVVEHDWAAAFDGVEGMDDEGEVPMPFDHTCFEFRVSGLRMLVLMGLNDGEHEAILCTGVNGHWYTTDERFKFDHGKFVISHEVKRMGGHTVQAVGSLLDLLGRQIRAVCIMLDAKVADAEREAPSAALNKARRAQGKCELKGYHVVRLHRRHRQVGHARGDEGGARKRAHVRRGHWRHFTVGTGQEQYTDDGGTLRSRTWINWMLVGDISLGFVDKEYRL